MIFFVFCRFLFGNQLFRKILSGIPSGCQTVWIQIQRDILSSLVWVQTVCKGYQRTTKVASSRQRVDNGFMMWMKNSVDPGQLDSLEASWSGSTLFLKKNGNLGKIVYTVFLLVVIR